VIVQLGGRGYSSNCYLVLEKKPTIIDTGIGENLLSEISKHIPPEKIKLVINTHCHFDHTGGNSLFPQAKIVLHEVDAVAVREGSEKVVLNGLFGGEIERRVDRTVKDGDVIDLGSAKLRVIHTPGHTAGSMCLEFGNALFTGDTLFAESFGRTDLPTGSGTEIKESLELLKSLDYETAYPGHGPSFTKRDADVLITDLLSSEF